MQRNIFFFDFLADLDFLLKKRANGFYRFHWCGIRKFRDQGDAKWILIRRSLWGHNDTPGGRPAPGRPIGRPGPGRR
jgi:hypothetical protein